MNFIDEMEEQKAKLPENYYEVRYNELIAENKDLHNKIESNLEYIRQLEEENEKLKNKNKNVIDNDCMLTYK